MQLAASLHPLRKNQRHALTLPHYIFCPTDLSAYPSAHLPATPAFPSFPNEFRTAVLGLSTGGQKRRRDCRPRRFAISSLRTLPCAIAETALHHQARIGRPGNYAPCTLSCFSLSRTSLWRTNSYEIARREPVEDRPQA